MNKHDLLPVGNCGDPGAPANGKRTGSNFNVGGTVVFSCNTGYTRQGAQSATCQANKAWTPAKPTCQGMNRPSNIDMFENIVETIIERLPSHSIS